MYWENFKIKHGEYVCPTHGPLNQLSAVISKHHEDDKAWVECIMCHCAIAEDVSVLKEMTREIEKEMARSTSPKLTKFMIQVLDERVLDQMLSDLQDLDPETLCKVDDLLNEYYDGESFFLEVDTEANTVKLVKPPEFEGENDG